MKILYSFLISVVSVVMLAGCWTFTDSPFKESELKNINDTKFGKQLVKAIKKIPEDSAMMEYIGELKVSIEDQDAMVKDVSKDFLILAEGEPGKYTFTVLMKNKHHLFYCTMGQNESKALPESITIREEKSDMFPTQYVSGNQEDLRIFFEDQVNIGIKFCTAMPYKKVF